VQDLSRAKIFFMPLSDCLRLIGFPHCYLFFKPVFVILYIYFSCGTQHGA